MQGRRGFTIIKGKGEDVCEDTGELDESKEEIFFIGVVFEFWQGDIGVSFMEGWWSSSSGGIPDVDDVHAPPGLYSCSGRWTVVDS